MTKTRCAWAGDDPVYQKYHDLEWGVPVHSDKKLFEFLILEGMQAGLSWITVLKKREAFRKAFDSFDYNKMANYNQAKIDELLQNPGIIRNKLKIHAAVSNARAFLKVREQFGTFNKYIWGFVDNIPLQNAWPGTQELPASTTLAETISKDLKKRGFSFVGPTIVYSHMQATGMVNDHTTDCFRHRALKNAPKLKS
ncbi:MAG: DNA-3-methyladenine glycosylase I [Gammaproteobacteria bacterium]|nr:DNA-3-methyladenine glycosylase I [Gammaproteobacteria bacterium]